MMTAAATAEKVLADLEKGRLLRGEQLELAQEFLHRNPNASGRELTDFLVAKEVLGPAQVEELWAVYEQRLTVWGYTLVELLGCGDLGMAYKAVSAADDREYAVKVLPRRKVGSVSRVPQRLQAFLHFQHPSVAPLVHAGTAADRHYLVWPYVTGAEPLDAVIRKQGPPAPKHVVHYTLQMIRGLRALHAQGLFHGLLKPSNVLIGPGHRAVLSDLGIGFLLTLAKGESLLNTLTTTNVVAGAIDFDSPETVMDPAHRTPLSDQYSLGAVLYYCLTGQCPFPVEPVVKKMMAVQSEEPVPVADLNPAVPPRLAAVIARLMAKKPEDRYPSMAEVEAALQDLLARPPVAKPAPAAASPAPPPRPVSQPAAAPVPAPPPAAPQESAPPPPPVVPGRVVSLQDICLSPPAPRRIEAEEKGGQLGPVVWVVAAAAAGVLAWIVGRFLFG